MDLKGHYNILSSVILPIALLTGLSVLLYTCFEFFSIMYGDCLQNEISQSREQFIKYQDTEEYKKEQDARVKSQRNKV